MLRRSTGFCADWPAKDLLSVQGTREFCVHVSENFDGHQLAGSEEGTTWGRILVAVAFFGYLFVFVWRVVDTRLLYHGDMVVLTPTWWISFPWFQTGWGFFGEHVLQPGGIAKYIAALLAQYFFYPLAGALVFTLLGAAIYIGTICLGRAMQTRGCWAAAYLSFLAVLCIVSAYTFPLTDLVSVTIALFAVGLYAFVIRQQAPVLVRGLTYMTLSVFVFWTAGGSCLLFAIACGLIEWRQGRRGWLGVAYLAAGCLVLLAGTYVYLTNHSDLGFLFIWRRLFDDAVRSAIPTAVYCGQIAVMLLWSWFVDYRLRRARKREPANRTSQDQLFRDIVAVALLAGTVLLASFGLLDVEARSLLRANYLARMGKWSEMLDEITLYPPSAYPPCLLYDINRALYETGQLPELMFCFPQQPRFLIQFGRDAVPYRGCHELLMALGCVNEAEQTACEALEVRGPHPYVLRDLIMINIVKDRPEAARVFLNVLSRDVIHRGWAQDYLQRLNDNPRLDSDEEVARLRQAMVREDHILLAGHDLFDLLLKDNPRNRMAFEYRMAYWLLTCQLEKIAEQGPTMRELGYKSTPRNYAEAVLVNWQVNGQQTDLQDWRIDSETIERFKTFVALTGSRSSNPVALSQLTSGTYYEYFFSHSAMSP